MFFCSAAIKIILVHIPGRGLSGIFTASGFLLQIYLQGKIYSIFLAILLQGEICNVFLAFLVQSKIFIPTCPTAEENLFFSYPTVQYIVRVAIQQYLRAKYVLLLQLFYSTAGLNIYSQLFYSTAGLNTYDIHSYSTVLQG